MHIHHESVQRYPHADSGIPQQSRSAGHFASRHLIVGAHRHHNGGENRRPDHLTTPALNISLGQWPYRRPFSTTVLPLAGIVCLVIGGESIQEPQYTPKLLDSTSEFEMEKCCGDHIFNLPSSDQRFQARRSFARARRSQELLPRSQLAQRVMFNLLSSPFRLQQPNSYVKSGSSSAVVLAVTASLTTAPKRVSRLCHSPARVNSFCIRATSLRSSVSSVCSVKSYLST